MASTSAKFHEPVTFSKDQGNNINVTKPGTNLKDNVSVRSRKRKASGDMEENSKRHKVSSVGTKPPNSCEPSNVSAEDVRVGSRKRKASPDNERPSKRHRDGSNTEAVIANSSKRAKVSAEEVNAAKRNSNIGGETSKKKQEESERSFCNASSSTGDVEKTLPKENTSRADFEEKYKQLDLIGSGGFGFVYAGIRIADSFPVAIKHVQDPEIRLQIEILKVPREVLLMQKAAGGPESVGKCAAVSLLDWYYLDKVLILVMERPDPSMDLQSYMKEKGGCLDEHEAKILMTQMVDGAIDMHQKRVFHRDIKRTNILIDVSSSVPRVRIIDFGCGSFARKRPFLRFIGTFNLAPPEWHVDKQYQAGPTTVWQLGALLYRMLHSTNFSTPGFVRGDIQISSDLSEDCRKFLQRCLAIDPKERVGLKQLPRQPWLR